MELLDSRRLTGANLLWIRSGAVIDVSIPGEDAATLVEAWRVEARRALDAVGWSLETTATRSFPGGASLAISAPLDALYAATEVNEWAWAAAVRRVQGDEPSAGEATEAAARLRALIEAERNPALIALHAAASERRVAFVADDDLVSVGLGSGSITWPARDVPEPRDVDWSRVHDVPVALVTGTNGKSTTVRLVAAIAAAAGRVAGMSSTDVVRIGREVLELGDWSGPGGARLVVRDPRVEVAILETARGGMLRRGLALERADVACILNVAEDHLGEWGVSDINALADGKFIVTSVAKVLVLNADDPIVARHTRPSDRETVWFGLDPDSPVVRQHLATGGRAYLAADGALQLVYGTQRQTLLPIHEIPCTLGGTARHNVANALAAAAIAHSLGLGADAIHAGLAAFDSTPDANPGRLNQLELGGVRIIVDFAHNPHGYRAVFEMVRALRPDRLLTLLGQAGDRDDESIRELARITWRAHPDHVVIKELGGTLLRGRAPGEVAALLESELEAAGAPPDAWEHAPSELAAVRRALEWARPGDLLLLLVHGSRAEVLEFLQSLQTRGWRPGQPLP